MLASRGPVYLSAEVVITPGGIATVTSRVSAAVSRIRSSSPLKGSQRTPRPLSHPAIDRVVITPGGIATSVGTAAVRSPAQAVVITPGGIHLSSYEQR